MQTCVGCRNVAPSADVRNRRQLRLAQWNGAPGRSRTDMALQPADFLTHCGFHHRATRVWGLECATTITAVSSGHRSPPSTLYTCRCRIGRLGLARRCRGHCPGDSPTLTGSGQAVSVPAAQLLKSAASTSFATGALPLSLPGADLGGGVCGRNKPGRSAVLQIDTVNTVGSD